MDITSIISNMPLFHGLTSKGESFFSEGDEANGFYIILSGKVKVFKLSADGKEQIFHILETPEPFGEAAVFAGENYPACAQALVQTQVLFIPSRSFVDLISKEPSLALSMLALLSMRLRKLTTLVENLSLKEVPSRLAAYLLLLNDRNGSKSSIELDVSKNQMASLLGTIPETLSRILKRMADEELIKADARTISILDKDGLADLAEGNRKLS